MCGWHREVVVVCDYGGIYPVIFKSVILSVGVCVCCSFLSYCLFSPLPSYSCSIGCHPNVTRSAVFAVW